MPLRRRRPKAEPINKKVKEHMFDELQRLIELVEAGRTHELEVSKVWCSGCNDYHDRYVKKPRVDEPSSAPE